MKNTLNVKSEKTWVSKSLIMKISVLCLSILIAGVFRMILGRTVLPCRLGHDSVLYYRAAVNLVNGNGFSWNTKAPYEPCYFREPGLSYYYAAVLLVGQKCHWLSPLTLPITDKIEGEVFHDDHKRAVELLKNSQNLLQVLTILLFLGLIKDFISSKGLLIVSGLLAIYYPFAYFTCVLLRETLCTFLVILHAFAFYRYQKTNGWLWLFLSGFVWGLASLTFQVYLLLGFFPLAFLLITGRSFKKTVCTWSIMILVFVLTVAPWIQRVYRYYPDWRIVKTLGCSFTHEYGANMGLVASEAPLNFAKDPELQSYAASNRWYVATSKEIFSRSFSGEYKKYKARFATIRVANSEKKAMKYLRLFWNTFFMCPIYNKLAILHGEFTGIAMIRFLGLLFSIGVGISALFGITLYARRVWPVLPTLVCHLCLIKVLASECRRQLPVMPFLLFFAVLFLVRTSRTMTIQDTDR